MAKDPSVSAIERASTPYIDSLFKTCPHSTLSASGEDVGLPNGQFGNSEVGHLNIGAGRIVWQELSRINKSIDDSSFFENRILRRAFEKASGRGRIHIMGLFSDGGVHSHNNHLSALLRMAKHHGVADTWVHAFTDGRDTSPNGGIDYCKSFQKEADRIGTGQIASVIGRYFAMDRDNRWERTEKAYRLLVDGKGKTVEKPESIFTDSYRDGVTDEFIEPHLVAETDSRIRNGDVVLFYNIRGDRARQITRALLQIGEVPFKTEELNLHYTTFTSYDETFEGALEVAYPPVHLTNTLGEYLSSQGVNQLRIAETEKYPHVTYFFNGGEETPSRGEDRVMIPSPKVATYDLQPEMSAAELATAFCKLIREKEYGFATLNFANPDMVGHTGNMDAAVRAVETVDRELKRVVDCSLERGYKILVIADHGNADCMINPDGTAHTAHTTAPVPAILIGVDNVKMRDGILADVAPTLLRMAGLKVPSEMSGTPLY